MFILGATGALGGCGAIGWYLLRPGIFSGYKSYVAVANNRDEELPTEIILRDLERDEGILDESTTLDPDGNFRREDILSNNTEYRLSILAGELEEEYTFTTCCRGYMVDIGISASGIDPRINHMD